MLDQAASLRNIVGQMSNEQAKTCVISVLGVQAGVGKKSFALNLAAALAQDGNSVLIIDLSDDPKHFVDALQVDRYAPFSEFAQGEKRLEEVVRLGAERVKFFSGGGAMRALMKDKEQFKKAEGKLCAFCQDCDYILLVEDDCPVDEASKIIGSSDECFVVMNLAPESIVGGFKLLKQNANANLRLIISKQLNSEQTAETVENFLKVVERTVGLVPKQLGMVYYDPLVNSTGDALYVNSLSDCDATMNILQIAGSFLRDDKKNCSGLGKFLANMRD